MIRIRPLAGAVLMTLLLMPAAHADRVDIITPGGSTSLVPPASTEPRDEGSDSTDTSVDTAPREAASTSSRSSSDSGHSPAEVDVQPGLQTMHFSATSLACRVASRTHDLVVTNQSLEPLPPGTRIKWQLKKEGKRGYFAIIGELRGGESLIADDVLDGKAEQDEICVARVI